MPTPLPQLLKAIRACTHCAKALPCAPNPILQAHGSARIRLVGQAPGRKAHVSGIPWNDPSGDRLRAWLGLTREQFYNPKSIAIIPIGFCYPGKADNGDKPPRPECAPLWHDKLDKCLPNIALTLLIGTYAQAYYLEKSRKATLSDTVKAWEEYMPQGYLPLPHPSPRNQSWFKKNAWFELELVPALRKIIGPLSM